jgi:glycosyltransferase involved in cell wall biosynthesis
LEAYEPLIRDVGLEDRVRVLPPVSPDRINRFIRDADAGVILYYGITPDFEVALPNRLFHAVAAGLPILYPRLTEISALAERHGLGLPIDSRDPASIAEAARSLGEDDGAAERFGRAAAEATAELSWERQEPQLERAIRDALSDGRPGRSGAG